MSWLFKSLNSNDPECPRLHQSPERGNPGDSQGGLTVKDDISVIGQTLGRHLRGVANFLAPPPSSASAAAAAASAGSSDSLSPSSPSSQTLTGIRNDLVEIGGTFRSSISRFSSNKAVSGISKFASQLLQFEDETEVHGEEYRSDGVPGITDQAVRFVKQISIQPECWTEFPLPLDNDFSMSNAQREHALTMERLVPEFVELRQNLCGYMNVEKFWMVYFLLLLPRLNQHDFELLSTPKMVETRQRLLQKLSDKRNLQVEDCESPRTLETCQEGEGVSATERVNNPSERNQILTEITNAAKELEIDDKTSFEQWSEDTDIESSAVTAHTKFQHEEDISDLEDYGSDLSDRLLGHRGAQDTRVSSPDGSNDWVQLKGSSDRGGSRQKAVNLKGKDSEDESSDWLAVDEFN